MDKAREVMRAAFTAIPKGGPGGKGGPEGSAIVGMAKSLTILGGVSFLGYQSIYNVPGGHKAVVWNRMSGLSDKVEGEGYKFRVSSRKRPRHQCRHLL